MEMESNENRQQNHKTTEYIDQALQLTDFGKFNYSIIIISGLIITHSILETLAISYALTVSKCEMNFSVEECGVLSAIAFIGIIVSSHFWGFLADTTGRRKIIRPTLLIGFIATVFSSFSKNFWTLLILRFINGVCVSGSSATIYAYLAELHANKHRSRAIMASAIITGCGGILLPALAWLIINQEWKFYVPLIDIYYKPWRLYMILCGLTGFLCGLSLYKIPESPKFLLCQGNEEKALDALKTMYHMNTGKPKEDYMVGYILEDLDLAASPIKQRANQNKSFSAIMHLIWDQTQPIFNRKYIRATTLICFLQFWTYCTSDGLYMWFPYVLNTVSEFLKENPGNHSLICDIVQSAQAKAAFTIMPTVNSTSDGIGNITNIQQSDLQCNDKLEIKTFQDTFLLEILYTVGFALLHLIINKIGKVYILFIIFFICGICGLLMVFVNIPMVSIYLFVVLLLCGLAMTILNALCVDLYPTKLRAMSIGISMMVGRVGSVVGSVVTGALLTNYCTSAFITSGLFLIISGFLAFLIPKPKTEIEKRSTHE